MPKLKFDVAYYDVGHEKALSSLSIKTNLEDAVEKGLEVDRDEYLVYAVFREQKTKPGWKTFAELKQKLPSRLTAYTDYFDLDSGTVRSAFIDQADLDTTQTEASGVVTYSPVDFWPHNAVLFVTDFKGNFPRFVYYFLKAYRVACSAACRTEVAR